MIMPLNSEALQSPALLNTIPRDYLPKGAGARDYKR